MDSILNYVKKNIGVSPDDDSFDADIISSINTAFSFLYRMGVPARADFAIEDSTTVWTDYLPDIEKYNFIKTYVWVKTKMVFDPSANGTITESYNSILDEAIFSIDDAFNYQSEINSNGSENSK